MSSVVLVSQQRRLVCLSAGHSTAETLPPLCVQYTQLKLPDWLNASLSHRAVRKFGLLRAKAAMLSARLSHRNSVRLSVRHTGGSGKNGPS